VLQTAAIEECVRICADMQPFGHSRARVPEIRGGGLISRDGSSIRHPRRLDPRDDQQRSKYPEHCRAEAKEGDRELNFPRLDFESDRAITDDLPPI
jgi:hypothetical protein